MAATLSRGGSSGVRAAETMLLQRASETAWPALYVAATRADEPDRLAALLKLHKGKASPVKGDTLLTVAARFGNVSGLGIILTHGYDINEAATKFEGRSETPLYTAALWGQPACIKLLLQKGASAGKAEALQAAKEAHHCDLGGGSAEDYAECVRLLS
ncbi:hypothetical protein AB1Y20_005511 [Prymnesium parvum]|uniref:Uncharacterized protein n=1 Tax=Prymnesium parvum TaxID=97485 RepID=A0AB34J6N7_PRYPA